MASGSPSWKSKKSWYLKKHLNWFQKNFILLMLPNLSATRSIEIGNKTTNININEKCVESLAYSPLGDSVTHYGSCHHCPKASSTCVYLTGTNGYTRACRKLNPTRPDPTCGYRVGSGIFAGTGVAASPKYTYRSDHVKSVLWFSLGTRARF